MNRIQKLALFISFLISPRAFYAQQLALTNESQEIAIKKEKVLIECQKLLNNLSKFKKEL